MKEYNYLVIVGDQKDPVYIGHFTDKETALSAAENQSKLTYDNADYYVYEIKHWAKED